MTTPLIQGLFLLGPVVVVPILLETIPRPGPGRARVIAGAARRLAAPAGWSLVVAFILPVGPLAGAFAIPWLAVGGLVAVAAILDALEAGPTRIARIDVALPYRVAAVFLAVSAIHAVADRLGIELLGFGSTIVLLTAVHFTFAGFVLVVHGGMTYAAHPSGRLAGAVAIVVVGIPITAIGFLGIAIAAWFGALLVALGGLGIGVATIVSSRARPTTERRLFRLAGASLLMSMPLAAAYATGNAVGAAWLSIPAMAATHGTLNVLGFAVPAAVAWRALRADRIDEP